ncbi:MAG: energy-coupling factor transporter ATPase [Oscillospiraceae bacterium]
MPMIKTENLTHVYSEGTPFRKVAIDNVNLEIEQGEFLGVIGHTGSGKSTLIQHFNGLIKPTSGKIWIDGQDLWADKEERIAVRFKVGLVFQYPEYQLFEQTVYKDIAFGPKNMKLDDGEVDKRVRRAAAFVGLKPAEMQKSPFELSGGQKRRVAIAGVLAMEPKVLILDEPTAGLDPKGRDMILGQIKEYHQTEKSTILLVSHSMEDVATYANNVLVMNKSEVFMHDTIQNVFTHAEEIEQMGLSVPQITQVVMGLRARGFDLPANIYTVSEAKNALIKLVGKGGKS